MILVRMRVPNTKPVRVPIIRRNNANYISNPSRIIHPCVLEELKFKDNHDFGFDIHEPKNWLTFIKQYRLKKTGELLPRYIKIDGRDIPIIYDVYKWGGQPPNTSLFPGYDKDGRRLHPLKYGRIS